MSEFSERLDAIEARANAATEGPWVISPDLAFGHPELRLVSCEDGKGDVTGYLQPEDAEFIATARTDIPWLVSELRKAHATEARVRGLAKEWVRATNDGGVGYTVERGATGRVIIHVLDGEVSS